MRFVRESGVVVNKNMAKGFNRFQKVEAIAVTTTPSVPTEEVVEKVVDVVVKVAEPIVELADDAIITEDSIVEEPVIVNVVFESHTDIKSEPDPIPEPELILELKPEQAIEFKSENALESIFEELIPDSILDAPVSEPIEPSVDKAEENSLTNIEPSVDETWDAFVDNVILPTLCVCVDKLKEFIMTKLGDDLKTKKIK